MKKLLSILGIVSLIATGASSVVACKKTENKNDKTNMYQFHHLNTLHRQFEKWQIVEPRLRKFKNREEFLASIDAKYQTELEQMAKQKAEFQASIKAKYSANKKSLNLNKRENNSLIDKFNTHYEKNKGDPPKISKSEHTQLLDELDTLD